ncbi:MAG: hypothetical protein ACR2QC_04470 [Gammaproteobacteria bacterium]
MTNERTARIPAFRRNGTAFLAFRRNGTLDLECGKWRTVSRY